MNQHWQKLKKDIGKTIENCSLWNSLLIPLIPSLQTKLKQRGKGVDFVGQTETPLFTSNDNVGKWFYQLLALLFSCATQGYKSIHMIMVKWDNVHEMLGT